MSVCMLGLVACSAAGADDRALPAGWKPLPSIATAARAAIKADGVVVDRADAAGDPASGCYAIWLDIHSGKAEPSALVDEILAGMTGITVHDVVKPGADGVMSLGFERAPYRGRLRARLGAGTIAATACFANAREPAHCEATCAQVLR
jgi:hypothetical protein